MRGIYLPRSADAVAGSVATYGVPLLVLATTSSGALTGLAFALEWLPRLSAIAGAGALADRYGAAVVFRLATLARAGAALAAAVMLHILGGGPGTTATVLVLAATLGLLTQCSYIASETQGACAARAAGGGGHRVQSALLGLDQAALLAGPALSAALLHWVGPDGMLMALAAVSLLGALLTPRTPVLPASTSAPERGRGGIRVGWSTLRAIPALAWLVAGVAASNVAVGMLQAAAPVIVVNRFGQSTASVGLVWTVAAAVSLTAVAACRRAIDRFGLWPVGAACAPIAVGACVAVATVPTYGSYLTATTVLMAADGGLAVVLRTVRSHLIPASVYASTLAATVLLLLAPYPLAGVLVALVPVGGLGPAIIACAVLQAIGLACAFARLRMRRAALPGETDAS
ncbi:MFS transporter [Streptomyces ramulosus]